MPQPVHHAALAAAKGKIYVMGSFVPPKDTAIPLGGAWEPIDNAWEYDPEADSWKSLPPLPGKRGSAVAAEVGGKIYVIGGATTVDGSKDPFFSFFGPSRVLGTDDVYDPATNKWQSREPMSVPHNHAFAASLNEKIYVIGGRTRPRLHPFHHQHGRGRRSPAPSNTWSVPKADADRRSGGRLRTNGRRIYVAGVKITTRSGRRVRPSSVRPGDNSWRALPSMPIPRHGVAGAVLRDRLHLVSGIDPVRRSADVPRPHSATHAVMHDVLELPFGASPPTALCSAPGDAVAAFGKRSAYGRLPRRIVDGCDELRSTFRCAKRSTRATTSTAARGR